MLSRDLKDIQIILEHSPTWDDIQSQLYNHGCSYVRKGGGAVIRFFDGTEIKASSVSRGASLFHMEKRLGPMPDGPSISLCKAIATEHTALRKRLLALVRDAIDHGLPSPESCSEISQILANAGDYAWHVAHEYWLAVKTGKRVAPLCTISEVWLRHYLASLKPTQAPPLSADAIAAAMYDLPDTLEFRREQLITYHKALQPDCYRLYIGQRAYREKTIIMRGRIPYRGIKDIFTKDQVYFRLSCFHEFSQAHVYYTPLSDRYHYILIDDVSPINLHNILAQGLRPACIWASSPGNFQMIFKLAKTGDPETDRLAGNAVARAVNVMWGDVKFSGAIHAHRAPGFANIKSDYVVDGKAPVVHIVQATGDECGILARLYRWLLPHIQDAKTSGRTSKGRQPVVNRQSVGNCCDADIAIYLAHHREVCTNWQSCGIGRDKLDHSAIDAAVAERLRGTGHKEDEVAKIIASGGAKLYERGLRPNSHAWADYGRRTAAYAFSATGTRRLAEHQGWVAQWKQLEAQVMSIMTSHASN